MFDVKFGVRQGSVGHFDPKFQVQGVAPHQ